MVRKNITKNNNIFIKIESFQEKEAKGNFLTPTKSSFKISNIHKPFSFFFKKGQQNPYK